jgi:hypothetical protein
MNSWADIGFELETTADSSLTLRLLKPNYADATHGESMHHSGGACAETLLIYGTPLREILQTLPKARFLVVGLGLGYIEMVIAREALLLGKTSACVDKITSFESVPALRKFFFLWVQGESQLLPQDIYQTYQSVAQSVVQGTNLVPQDLQKFLKDLFPHEEIIQGSLAEDFSLTETYHGIMYDAFSSKTTPHLWEENFLVKFLTAAADRSFCLYSTYACRVSLKSALAQVGFEVIVRPGFQGKRNSTLGRLIFR